MSNDKGFFTEGNDAFEAKVNAIPLTDVDATNKGSIGERCHRPNVLLVPRGGRAR